MPSRAPAKAAATMPASATCRKVCDRSQAGAYPATATPAVSACPAASTATTATDEPAAVPSR